MLRQLLFFALFFSTQVQAETYSPNSFVQAQVLQIQQHYQTPKLNPTVHELNISPSRNALLKALYEHHLVDSGVATELMTDKLLVAKLLEFYLGEKAFIWHPKTVGLKDFLLKHQLLTSQGQLKPQRDLYAAALKKEFPYGNIVKPATGMNSEGKSKGFYFKMDKFIDELLAEGSDLFSAEELKSPFVSPLTQKVASGEKLILQENVITAAGITRPLKTKEFIEIRVHTFGQQVVTGATSARWKELDGKVTKEHLKQVEEFVQQMLDQLPTNFVGQQAWGMDVAVMDNGVMRLIEINNNRGKAHHWSGFLSRPSVLKAYANHLEQSRHIHINGLSGALFRLGLANYPSYIEKTLAGEL